MRLKITFHPSDTLWRAHKCLHQYEQLPHQPDSSLSKNREKEKMLWYVIGFEHKIKFMFLCFFLAK